MKKLKEICVHEEVAKRILNTRLAEHIGDTTLKEIQLLLQSDSLVSLQMSSLFQGVLMQKITENYADKMHISDVRPYSQFINEKKNEWNIHLLNEEAEREIGEHILDNTFTSFFLEKKNCKIKIIEKKVIVKSYDQLLKETYFTQGNRYITLKFLTPTAFRQRGSYINYPDLRLLFQSIMQKHDAIQKETKIFDEDALEHIVSYTTIIKYHLRTKEFCLEGVRIPAFVGTITLKVGGPQMLVNLVHFLAAYAEYSGVGIKTAIGMGAVTIKQDWRKEHGETKESDNCRKFIS